MAAPGVAMDDGRERGVKLNKTDRKSLRKQRRARHVLLRHESIRAVPYPTQCLVVANGGLGNGVSRQQLLAALEACGPREALLTPPDKPYAFVTFPTVQACAQAYAALNGKAITDHAQHTVVLYVNYVERAHGKTLAPQALPPGLLVVEEIVSPEDESRLLDSVDWAGLAQKDLKHRRVKHFGYEFHYEDNTVDKDQPLPGGLPEVCNTILEKWLQDGLIRRKPDQLTVNEYQPGHGIPAHIDTHSAFEDEIISLSLGSEIVMDFKHPDGESVPVMLPRRSLLVMAGESRYLWTHGITPRKFDVVQASGRVRGGVVTRDVADLTLSRRGVRTSFTFRTVRRVPCSCGYPSVCDSRNTPTGPAHACRLEREHVHRVYDAIAGHFSSTRRSPWPRVAAFLAALPGGALVADVGCGNGKYLGVNPELYMLGCDRSRNLVDICRGRGFQAVVCDALSVPLRGGAFDACVSIAVVHHFSTAARRLAALRELTRLLRPGGHALVYVWALEQEYRAQASQYLARSRGRGGRKGPADPLCADPGRADPPRADPLCADSPRTDPPRADPLCADPPCADPLCADSPRADPPCADPLCADPPQADPPQADPAPADPLCAPLPVHTKGTPFPAQDLLVPWHLPGKPGPRPLRFYHVFREGELAALGRAVGGVRVLQTYYDQGNWCAVLEKL